MQHTLFFLWTAALSLSDVEVPIAAVNYGYPYVRHLIAMGLTRWQASTVEHRPTGHRTGQSCVRPCSLFTPL